MGDRVLELMEDLKSPDNVIKKYAAEDLGDLRDQRAIDPLIELFANEEIAIREAAAEALIKIGGEDAVKKVSMLLGAEVASIRNFAMDILINIGNEAVEIVKGLIHDPDHDIRKYAVDILGLIGSQEASTYIIEALEDEHINVKCGAVEALGNIGEKIAIDPLISLLNKETDPWLKFMLVESLGKIKSDKALDSLHKLLMEKDPLMVSSSIQALGKIGNIASIDYLLKLIEDAPMPLKQIIVEAFERIDTANDGKVFDKIATQDLVDKLLLLVDHEKEHIRKSIAKILGKINHPKSMDTLLLMLGDEDIDVHETVSLSIISLLWQNKDALKAHMPKCEGKQLCHLIQIIGNFNDDELSESLFSYVKHSDPEIRRETALAMGKSANPKFTDTILKLCLDEDRDVRLAAIKALSGIDPNEAIPKLLELICSPVKEICDVAGETFKTFPLDEKTVSNLADLLRHENEYNRIVVGQILTNKADEKIIDQIVFALNSETWRLRKIIVDAVGKSKLNKYVDALIPALNDEERYVRISAIVALSNMDSEKSLKYLTNMVNDSDERIRYEAITSLRKFEASQVGKTLVEALDDTSMMVKMASIDMIAELQYTSALPVLEKMLRTVEDDVADVIQDTIDILKNNS